ncbi:MAG: hypothetical protein WAU39_15520, partial [Polyangiales bacterium]
MKHSHWLVALAVVVLPLWGCGDDVCQDFNSPTSQACEVTADCSEINCESVCSDVASDSRGAAFCDNTVCFCPCTACVRV